ncbi:MAG TPA: aminotransferase class I/II-fold pyridoxal phosphate-dependent enzyme [Lutibacter sp.]|nr:aminotransferase class I/II-fold pyridoxal phosphate-dependent enzyme [Lutibacter sp.]
MHPADRVNNIQEYYFSRKMREIQELLAKGKPVVNLGIGNPDLPPPASVIQALLEASSDLSKQGYQPYKGLPEFREAIASFYKKHYKVSLDYNSEILPLAGAKEGIMHISMAYLNKDDAVLIPNPGYSSYTTVTKMLGATPVLYDLKAENNWQPDINALEKLDLSKVKIIWVNYPNMPTGAKASISLFKKLISFTQKHDILLVNDNPYSFILNENPISVFSEIGMTDSVLELNSLSKSFNMAGWRVGMLVGSKQHIDNVLKIKSNMDSGMFYGLQKGAIAALHVKKQWFNELNNIYKTRRNLIWKIADKLACTYEKEANGFFVWAKLPDKQNDMEISNQLLSEQHIFVTPGSIFGNNGNGHLRFSLCVDEKVLNEILGRIS